MAIIFNENITLHFYTASSKSISESKGGQRSEHFTPGTGPIFVPSLQCPPDPNLSDNPYVECLNELILGQTECSHEDDIGIICEGTYSGIINAFLCVYACKINDVQRITLNTCTNIFIVLVQLVFML